MTDAAIYTVFTSPHHAPMPNHLPTLIVTPHGQPQDVLYTYLHTEENRVNYLLTPSPQGDLCVAKLFPPPRPRHSSASLPAKQPANAVRCEASRDLRWTIENTGVMSPIYKIVNQDDTPLYQISKPNPNAEFWTMFYFKYAGHQIPPKRIEFGKVAKNPPEKGGGTRITITGKSEDEKQVWQTLGVGNEDCVEWVVCCACLNLLDDQILQAAEKKAGILGPASTASAPAASPASTSLRPVPAPLQRVSPASTGPRSASSPIGPGIASSSPVSRAPPPSTVYHAQNPASNLSATYRQNPPPQMAMRNGPPPPQQPQGQGGYRGPPPMKGQPPMRSPVNGPPQGGFDPRRGPPPPQQQGPPSGYAPAPQSAAGRRRF
ncbi:hypothetical protein CI109_100830 [Kwoniella shandongensis]|uniref:Uncharacterized protein n=1 Tax=Kwoniella shandongensis TaxID=1734106 RepID=A0A5M6BPE5_9TREE|nr:uncharacterized protein CI109_006920 [Kwoniella shandongensis]KAA5524766.1 hypothetical protein CI109_006920 [Kwoniella shandongensis]